MALKPSVDRLEEPIDWWPVDVDEPIPYVPAGTTSGGTR